MLVVWGRRQPLCCHSEIHVEVAQQTHTAELLQTGPPDGRLGICFRGEATDMKNRKQ